jgi:23S rRNA (uridine2552-2'-O)-methyltransferase
MARTKHGQSWIQRHVNDPFVKKAQVLGYRSRASFKLLQLQQKAPLFAKGMTIIDLGAAPGGWSQVLAEAVGPQGTVIALDLLEMAPLKGVTFIQGDFCHDEILHQLTAQIGKRRVDWVVSDMSPNLSGIMAVDQPRIMYLADLTWDFAQQHLKKEGGMIVKVFQGEGFDQYIKILRAGFKKVTICKPEASRSASRELYVLAQGYYNI